MWPFGREKTKAEIQGWRKIRINHSVFTIRKLNPLLDFTSDRMPQMFSSFVSRRPADPTKIMPEAQARLEEDVRMVLEAGVVTPTLVAIGKGEKRGKEDGITADDLLRDDTGVKLYTEIITHSLNRFRGMRGVFFSIKIRRALSMQLRKATESLLYRSPSPTVATP